LPGLPQQGSGGPVTSAAEAAPASGDGVPLLPGWNLISLPRPPDSVDPAAVFSSIAGSYTIVHSYDACDAEPWRTWDPAAPGASDLTSVDHRAGLWVRATAAATLAVSGTEPAETSIHLCQGWNLIGYPLAQPRPVLAALSSIASKFRRVFGWDPADPVDPWEVFDVAVPAWANDLEQMQPGRGYWIYATEETTLVMSNAGLPPEVEITAPANAAAVTAPTDVVGTVKSDLLEQWTLAYRLKGETASTTFAKGNTPVVAGVLGKHDPSLLLNGMYEIELTATDFQGQSTSVAINTTVEEERKIGNFTLPFLDVEVPVLGLPIQVVRTYDSRDKRQGDFGYGWSLTLTDIRLQESVAPGDDWRGTRSGGVLPTYCITSQRLHMVTVSLPGGEVLRFRARPSPECQSIVPPQVVTLLYEPLPGTRATLQPVDQVTQALVVGSFPGPVQLWEQESTSLQDPDLYRLTLPDGRSLLIDQLDGLRSLSDLNGNVLTFQPNGITHPPGDTGLTFQRDSQGRITRITDPLSNSVSYVYDARGDLVSVTDQEGLITRFTYLADHFLHTIIDPGGQQIVAAEYQPDGRLKSRCNAGNQCTTLVHDLNANREVQTDATGRPLTYIYDQQGDVLSITDALGNQTRYEYDAAGNKTRKIDATGVVTSYGYDSRGFLVSVTDPYPPGADPDDYTTRYIRNDRGQATTVTLPTGSQTLFEYDASGNLTGIRDDSGRKLLGRTYGAGGLVTSESDP